MRHPRCRACARDAHQPAQYTAFPGNHLTAVYARPDDWEVCRRASARTLQWYEREPGWFRDEVARIRAQKPRGLEKPRSYTPPCQMTLKQRQAELLRQSRRLAGHVELEEAA